ncbi:ATP-binding protein [Paracandidimonas soli]|uniref:ATP-binding protein n=1 Tax=Paracandidimonas soli TaxID=1917182 RepID=UPI000A8484A0
MNHAIEHDSPNVFAAGAPVRPYPGHSPLDDGGGAGRKNMQQLIQLRWIAVLGQVVTILSVRYLLGIALPLGWMLSLVLLLAVFNAVSILRLRLRQPVHNRELFAALLLDVLVLTAQLYFSGGISNPFVFLYLLQLTLAAMLLRPWSTWILVASAVSCILFLALSSQPLALAFDHEQGIGSLYVQGLVISFLLNAALIVVFITRISRNLRARDIHLAAMRQQAAEEEHIVRMGLLASGAAHELGTPLSTMAVILGDWQHSPAFSGDAEMKQEIGEMQAQVLRCKSIVNGILLSAGEARGDVLTESTVHTFLEELIEEWRTLRQPRRLVFENRFGEDLPIMSDTALKQMICNVLDNALEASPDWLRVIVSRQDEQLILTVLDGGQGFDADILANLGKPYHSSKGKPGGGLGLFLSMNVARTLGGSITAQNLIYGGASVTLTLPLSAITLDEDTDDAADG